MSRLSQSRFHFIGIGGIGMSGLAELLKNMGAKVTGSDLSENAQVQRLKALGIPIKKGHAADNLRDPDVVVYSSAVKLDKPEIQAARENKIPIIRRAEALAEIMRLKRGIAVGGTHGKTTTTSLMASVFIEAQWSPTVVVGGRLDLIKSTSFLGQGEWLIAEADESDGSFNLLSPEIAVITNIDKDHLDHYKNFAAVQEAFYNFAEKIPFYGSVIACGDDPIVRSVFKDFSKRIVYYGFNEDNDLILKKSRGQYSIFKESIELGTFRLQVPGEHNALNGLAAFAAAMEAGISPESAIKGLYSFAGVDRRFHHKGREQEVDFYDDYGHHPTEVRATLKGFRERFPDRRLVVLFQPHRYSRTEACWDDFKECFSDCDELFITDIYAAGEKPLPEITSETMVSVNSHGRAQYIPRSEATASELKAILKEGDVFLTLGAGDVWKIGEEVKSLKAQG